MNRRILAFRVVFLLLALNFLFPSLLYLFAPERALESLRGVIALAGAPPFPLEREQGVIWRTLAGTNVLALAFMCFLLLWDVRRFYAVLAPLVFLKATTALAYLAHYFVTLRHPLFIGIFVWDGIAVLCFLYFAPRARAALAEVRA